MSLFNMKVNVHVYDLKSDLTDLFFKKKIRFPFFRLRLLLNDVTHCFKTPVN